MSLGNVRWKIDKRALAQRAVKNAAADGLGEFAEAILTESSAIVPIEEGDLDRSGDTDLDREKLQASVFYDTPYAVRQHEDMGLNHDEGRQAKYLETPLKSRGREMGPHIAKKIRAAIS